jgi:hypothetical protein
MASLGNSILLNHNFKFDVERGVTDRWSTKDRQMKKIILTTALAMLVLTNQTQAADVNGLYGDWCLIGMSAEENGELIPDNAIYQFTKNGILNYSTGFFKQSGKYEIVGEKIKTKEMGSYKIISIGAEKMVLYYGGYMKFTKGKCK